MSDLATAPSLTYKFPTAISSASFVFFLPLYASLVAGTGGIYHASALLDANAFTNTPLIRIDENRRRAAVVTSVSHHIAKIRSAFGLNMSDLANLFSVSRPTAYSWLQGTDPKPQLLARIWKLSSYADSIIALGLPRMHVLVKRPLANGTSLFAALQKGADIDTAISHIKNLSENEYSAPISELRERTARKSRIHAAEEVSIPMMERD